MEQARLERLAHARKITLLIKLIFIAENMRYQTCVDEISKVEDELLELERREMAEVIKADSIKIEETKSEHLPSKPKPEEKTRSLLTFFKAKPKPEPTLQSDAFHALFQKLETCMTVSKRIIQNQAKWEWSNIEELFPYLKQRRFAARSNRIVNIFNCESSLIYFNYGINDDPRTINARNPFKKVFDEYCDSDQEFELGSADEINSDEESESQQDDASCIEAGFIVSDVSDSELSDDDPALLKQQIKQAHKYLAARRNQMFDLGDQQPIIQTEDLDSYKMVKFEYPDKNEKHQP